MSMFWSFILGLITILFFHYMLINGKRSISDMSTIVHFEIPSDNVDRSKKFYGDLFGWSIDKVPPEKMPDGMEYWMITTTDDKGN